MHDEDFKQVIIKTIQSLPQDIALKLSNIEVTVEEQRPVQMTIQKPYNGLRRWKNFISCELPTKITIYKLPLLSTSGTLDEARGRIKDALIREISIHFGVSEVKLRKVPSAIG